MKATAEGWAESTTLQTRVSDFNYKDYVRHHIGSGVHCGVTRGTCAINNLGDHRRQFISDTDGS